MPHAQLHLSWKFSVRFYIPLFALFTLDLLRVIQGFSINYLHDPKPGAGSVTKSSISKASSVLSHTATLRNRHLLRSQDIVTFTSRSLCHSISWSVRAMPSNNSFSASKSDTTTPGITIPSALSTIGRSAKYVVSLIVVYILITNESPLPFYYIVAAVLTSLFGKLLKRIIKQPRPEKSPKKGFGMPSSHTGAITFFATSIFYKSHLFLNNPNQRIFLNIIIICYGFTACSWRVMSHLHSISQILAGAMLGFCGASVAQLFEDYVVVNFYEHLLLLLSKILDGRGYYESGDLANYAILMIKLGFSALGACVVFHRELLTIFKMIVPDIDNEATADSKREKII